MAPALATNHVLISRPAFRYPSCVSWDRQQVEALVLRIEQARVRAEEAGERAQMAQQSLHLTLQRMAQVRQRARLSTGTG